MQTVGTASGGKKVGGGLVLSGSEAFEASAVRALSPDGPEVWRLANAENAAPPGGSPPS